MVKLTEKNRSVILLVGTLVLGILITGIVMLVENNDIERVELVNDNAKSNSTSLENKIYNLKVHNFDPASYSTISQEIDMSYKQDLITTAVRTNLETRLKSTYSDLVYSKCELFLMGNPINSSSNILSWLTQVERISARNAKIDNYRNQLKLYEYYSNVLPARVEYFIQGGTATFVESTYLAYKNELEAMPGLDPKYRNTAKFYQIKTRLISKLSTLYNIYSQPAPELEPNT